MENLQIISQLLEGNHLEPNKLLRAQSLINRLNIAISSRLNTKEGLKDAEQVLFMKLYYYLDRIHPNNYNYLKEKCNCKNFDTLFNSIVNKGYILPSTNPKTYVLV